jgi:hypothetical protein
MQQSPRIALRIECFSVSFCGSISRSASRGTTIRTSPFVKLKASSYYCIHVGTDESDDPQGFAGASLLVYCMLTRFALLWKLLHANCNCKLLKLCLFVFCLDVPVLIAGS